MGLKGVIQAIEQEMEKLNHVLHLLTGGKTKGKRTRHKMSAAGRKRIAAGQRKRWAKVKAGKK